jgi:hypothetical protein
MTKVLYITGWGRSGTTIVDNILNAYKGVFSAGELVYLWTWGLRLGRRCGCGAALPECELWRAILRTAYGGRLPRPDEVVTLQRQAIRVRATPGLLRGTSNPAAEAYRRILEPLYPAIAEVTGADLIVDSSKSPAAAALLRRLDGVESYLVHMIRDPRAVAHSWGRPTVQLNGPQPRLMRRQSPARSTARWLAWNVLSERVGGHDPDRFRRLRYEDFVVRPREAVEDLLAFTGTAAVDAPFLGEHTVILPVNHTVSGNPGRFRSGEVQIRPDDRWRHDSTWGPRVIATALALPLLPRYGYPVLHHRDHEVRGVDTEQPEFRSWSVGGRSYSSPDRNLSS